MQPACNPYPVNTVLYWHWEGYTVREIAQMLALNESEVRARVVAEWKRKKERG